MKKLIAIMAMLLVPVAAHAYVVGIAASGGGGATAADIDADVATHAALDTAHYGEVQVIPFDFTTDVATGDGAFYFHIGQQHAGKNLTYVHAEVITAGTTGTQDIQIHNVTDAVDMLSTKLTIDTTETGSDTAATAAVIDTTKDDVAENDVIRIDVDAVQTTAAKGLIVTMGFETP